MPRHQRPRLGLLAHRRQPARRGADEGQARRLHPGGEAGILRQEAIAGVQRIGAGGARQLQQPVLVQVALSRRGGADGVDGIGFGQIGGAGIGFRMHRDGPQAQRLDRADDARRHRAPVRHQHAAERE